MSVTLGFAMRIGDFPPAVMLPPVPQPVVSNPPVIDAQVIPESGASSTRATIAGGRQFANGYMRSGASSGQQYFRNHATTYGSHGSYNAPSERSGFFLDLFA